MAENKNVTINFYKIESVLADISVLGGTLSGLSELEKPYGFFDGKSQELMFTIHEPIELSNAGRKLHLVSIVREKVFLPVKFDRDGNVTKAVENPNALGDIAYGLIDLDHMALLTIGGNVGMFSDFLRWLTGDSAMGTTPILIGNVRNQVNDWEIFRKVTLGVEAPAMDFVTKIMDSDAGQHCRMLEALSGLRIEITVSMGHSKGSLHKDAVKEFIKLMMNGENPTHKLKVSGKCFEELATTEYDLYGSHLKHKTEIVIAGSHIAPDEAKSCLYEAYQLHLDDIEANVEGDGE